MQCNTRLWRRPAAGHADDIFVPVDPETLGDGLAHAGFVETELEVGDYQIRFVARMPL